MATEDYFSEVRRKKIKAAPNMYKKTSKKNKKKNRNPVCVCVKCSGCGEEYFNINKSSFFKQFVRNMFIFRNPKLSTLGRILLPTRNVYKDKIHHACLG